MSYHAMCSFLLAILLMFFVLGDAFANSGNTTCQPIAESVIAAAKRGSQNDLNTIASLYLKCPTKKYDRLCPLFVNEAQKNFYPAMMATAKCLENAGNRKEARELYKKATGQWCDIRAMTEMARLYIPDDKVYALQTYKIAVQQIHNRQKEGKALASDEKTLSAIKLNVKQLNKSISEKEKMLSNRLISACRCCHFPPSRNTWYNTPVPKYHPLSIE